MEDAELTKEEALERVMATFEAEERAKWIGLEEAIQRSHQEAAPAPVHRRNCHLLL
jgi:hypothetical protein